MNAIWLLQRGAMVIGMFACICLISVHFHVAIWKSMSVALILLSGALITAEFAWRYKVRKLRGFKGTLIGKVADIIGRILTIEVSDVLQEGSRSEKYFRRVVGKEEMVYVGPGHEEFVRDLSPGREVALEVEFEFQRAGGRLPTIPHFSLIRGTAQ